MQSSLFSSVRLSRRRFCPAFTLTEILIVIGLIAILLGLLLPALGNAFSGGKMTQSMANMRQIATWMGQYSADNNDFVVPSRFDYSNNPYPGKIRSNPNPPIGSQFQGTWSDVLAGSFEVGVYPDALAAMDNDLRYDSPDRPVYDLLGISAVNSPFRSTSDNTRNWNDMAEGSLPLPFGPGAQEVGYPGLFAANNFFDAGWPDDPGNGHFTNGQIRAPERSMYLVDSFRGEVIEPAPDPFDMTDQGMGEVDFRYGGGEVCLMLFLDGHVEQQGIWSMIDELEGNPDDATQSGRGIRIRGLTER